MACLQHLYRMPPKPTLAAIVSAYGAAVKKKLSNPAALGQPEDQVRAPFEELLHALGELANLPRNKVALVGESSISDLKTRPDYAVSVHNALVGFVELKAPGKGADPRKFKDPHDKAQWQKLCSLPNLMYTDGNAFSVWRNGELVDEIIALQGDIATAGDKLAATPSLGMLFESFLQWEPLPPRNAKELAHTSARLCRLLRDEVTEQIALGSEALTSLATDWRKLLFPEANDEVFADGYAQAVTFGLLMARAKDIELATGLHRVSDELSKSSSLIGAALRLLTDSAENRATLKTSLSTLARVLDAVDWTRISKGDADTWLYFYEDFLGVYDNDLRKLTGSYYTPPEVVSSMVALVDEVLRSGRFGLHGGLAAPSVTLIDPATGTGTFMLGVLRRIAENVKADQGEGSVHEAVQAAIKRLIAFEMQLGPFAVAQLRILAEVVDLTGALPKHPVRMFVTNTLGDPKDDGSWIPRLLAPISDSRKQANRIKREEPVTVVIGNPPYKDKAKGLGGWVEAGDTDKTRSALLLDWMAPAAWNVGAHGKHLRNLYIYFWRWATWKVFDHQQGHHAGVVCYITVAGFLNGPGFQKMRDYLRRTCDDIWVIDCTPEGHQPDVNTRIFQGVQQPVCIVLASRSAKNKADVPATVYYHALPKDRREVKFKALEALRLKSNVWTACATAWRAAFLPASQGYWASYPALQDLFLYDGSGVMPGRTWVIAPDAESLEGRWKKLINAPADQKEALFHPHLRNGELGDKHSRRVVVKALHGYAPRALPVADEKGALNKPVRYGFRSFDRQWIIPDNRLINQPNPELWAIQSDRQLYLTAVSRTSPLNGPALTFTSLIHDMDHYNGRGGRMYPLWHDRLATEPNMPPQLLGYLSKAIGTKVGAEDLMAYIAAVAAHPAYTARFQEDLSTPGLRIPVTKDKALFKQAAELGRRIVWLHTFGERMADVAKDRPAQPPRLPEARRPLVPAKGAIPSAPADMPDTMDYDAGQRRLLVGKGYIENVDAAAWNYEVSGKHVVKQWFSYRKLDRSKPPMGDRRPPSKLGNIQPDHWLAEYTTELLNVLNVLTLLVDLEPAQAQLLEQICAGPLITADELKEAGALEKPAMVKKKAGRKEGPDLFS